MVAFTIAPRLKVKTASPAPVEAVMLPQDQLIIDRLRAFRATPGAEDEADIRWGAAGFEQFESSGLQQENFSVTIQDPEEDEPPPEKVTLEFTEIKRNVTPVRVENPDDPEQFVMVERIDDITFDGPDGIDRKFILTGNPE